MTKENKVKSPKSAKKSKDAKAKEGEPEAVPYEVRMNAVTVISKPMADEKKVIVVTAKRACDAVAYTSGLHRRSARGSLPVYDSTTDSINSTIAYTRVQTGADDRCFAGRWSPSLGTTWPSVSCLNVLSFGATLPLRVVSSVFLMSAAQQYR